MSQGPSTRQSSEAILRRLRSESFGVPPPPAAAAEEGEEFGNEGNTIAATNSQPLGMDTYHTVVRLSIDRSSAACQSLVETHRLASQLQQNSTKTRDVTLPQLVTSSNEQDSIHALLEREVLPLMNGVGDLLLQIETEATKLAIAKKRAAMLKRVQAEIQKKKKAKEEGAPDGDGGPDKLDESVTMTEE